MDSLGGGQLVVNDLNLLVAVLRRGDDQVQIILKRTPMPHPAIMKAMAWPSQGPSAMRAWWIRLKNNPWPCLN